MPRGRKSDDPWARVKLPNQGSKRATPASLKTDLHYARLKIWERLTWERYSRLCKFLKLTPEELASVSCIPHSEIGRMEEQNHLYRGGGEDWAGALVVTIIEAYCLKHLTKDVIENPFPNLDSSES